MEGEAIRKRKMSNVSEEEIREAFNFVKHDLQRDVRWSTYSKRLPAVHDILRQVAEEERTIEYGRLAEKAGTDRRAYLSKILDGIGYIENSRGNPPITVLVVHAGTGQPATEFLQLLDDLGIEECYQGTTEQERIGNVMEDVRSHDWTSA